MKLYAPSYYKKFKCIADKCSHSCCIGWEIDVDPETQEKYDALTGGYGEKIKESIEISDTPHFKLQKNDRCPHLNKQGLCNIITNLGEEYLCEICREHPRFYNFTPQGCEVGLGMACEEAARIILNSDFCGLEEIGNTEGEIDKALFNSLPLRQEIFALLKTRLTYGECLNRLYIKVGVGKDTFEGTEITELISSLEYLDYGHRELFLSSKDRGSHDENKLKRALAYFVYRHCAEADSTEDFNSRLCLCLFCESLLRRVASALGSMELAARIISEELEYSQDNTEAIISYFDF